MFLTRAFLDSSCRAVRADIASPSSLHKTVMRAFPNDAGPEPRRALGVLHRLDELSGGRVVLLIQSRVPPDPGRWPPGYALDLGGDIDMGFSNIGDNPAIRDVTAEHARIAVGQRFRFRLRGNTTRCIDTKSAEGGTRRSGRRVPVRGDEERLKWLKRQADAAGFSVEGGAVRVTELRARSGRPGEPSLAGADFDGLLFVADAARFRQGLATGLGRAKAFGFGLLSIAAAK
jgi:CRISPR system Cascade subunit CasE